VETVVKDGLIFPEQRDVDIVVRPVRLAHEEIDRPATGKSPGNVDMRHCLRGPGQWREVVRPINCPVE
jgi:hypothetical protein